LVQLDGVNGKTERFGLLEVGIKERSAERRSRIVAHRAANFDDAEAWDLDFWQNQTPEQRLSALVSIRQDIAKVKTRSSKTPHRTAEES